MNRSPNPYRDQHRALNSAANTAAGIGDYVEAARLQRTAHELKALGQAEVERRTADSPRGAPTIEELTAVPEPIEGGWRVAETEWFLVDVMKMGRNLRVTLSPKDEDGFYVRGWCYQGEALAAVVLRARLFNPDRGEEPEGWLKEATSGRRACAYYFPPPPEPNHKGYVEACPRCGSEREKG